MTYLFFNKINKYYQQIQQIRGGNSFTIDKIKLFKLLIKIVNNKNDNDIDIFYKKYFFDFKFNIKYYTILFDKELFFDSFDNTNDFINKICSPHTDEYLYKELNSYLLSQLIQEPININKNQIEPININKKQEEPININKKQEEPININKNQIEPININKKQEEPININNNQIEPIIINKKQEEPIINKKKRKQPISATMRRLVWNTHIGEEIGKANCLCCNITAITQLSFNCGHIIAEANGGATIVSNLKPICQNCNLSMGTKNMHEFMKNLI